MRYSEPGHYAIVSDEEPAGSRATGIKPGDSDRFVVEKHRKWSEQINRAKNQAA